MTFKEAVRAAPRPVDGAYRPGKQALETGHRQRVTCEEPGRLTGSINLDSALMREAAHARAPRWDYGLGYKPARGSERAIWIEVHPATTKEVSRVLKKLQWLRDWLNSEAVQLRRLTDRADARIRFVWIASAGVKIPRNSPQARQLNKRGIQQVIAFRCADEGTMHWTQCATDAATQLPYRNQVRHSQSAPHTSHHRSRAC